MKITREQRRGWREFRNWREDHPARTDEALKGSTLRGVNLYQAKKPYNDAWNVFHKALLKYVRKDNRLAVACAQYILRRVVLLEAYELALAAAHDYAAKLEPEVSQRRKIKNVRHEVGVRHNRPPKQYSGKLLIDFLQRYIELKRSEGSATGAAKKLSKKTRGKWTWEWIYRTLEPMTRK